MMPVAQSVTTPGSAGAGPCWTEVVQRIRGGDPAGMEVLYRVFTKGIRFFLYRQLGPQDLDDRVHDMFLMVAQSICRGDVRHPERLMGYVRTVLHRQVAAQIEETMRVRRNVIELDRSLGLSDRAPDPERGAIERQRQELALRLLLGITKRDREVLTRFYLEEQSAAQICREMKLTATQFRLIKSRAKARFGELGKRRFARYAGFAHSEVS